MSQYHVQKSNSNLKVSSCEFRRRPSCYIHRQHLNLSGDCICLALQWTPRKVLVVTGSFAKKGGTFANAHGEGADLL